MMDKSEIYHSIVICDGSILPGAKNYILGLKPKYDLELFVIEEVLFDITQHELVPVHIVLSRSEKERFLKYYSVTEAQLPRMTLTDPITRFYGLKPGQIVKIVRNSNAAGWYVTYRIVM